MIKVPENMEGVIIAVATGIFGYLGAMLRGKTSKERLNYKTQKLVYEQLLDLKKAQDEHIELLNKELKEMKEEVIALRTENADLHDKLLEMQGELLEMKLLLKEKEDD